MTNEINKGPVNKINIPLRKIDVDTWHKQHFNLPAPYRCFRHIWWHLLKDDGIKESKKLILNCMKILKKNLWNDFMLHVLRQNSCGSEIANYGKRIIIWEIFEGIRILKIRACARILEVDSDLLQAIIGISFLQLQRSYKKIQSQLWLR